MSGSRVTVEVHTVEVSSFRFADGSEFLGSDGSGTVSFNVSMPLDDDGFFGRECPECTQHFRIAGDDYDALPEDVRLWCVYCGHADAHDEFLTSQQEERLMRVAEDYAQQAVGKMFDNTLGRMATHNLGSAIQIKYRSRPFFPSPLPEINEERLVRERRCGECGLRYAVFGEHRFCPACGRLPALSTALDGLAAESRRLGLLAELSDESKASHRETGVLDRTYVDTIENVVSLVEVLAERTFTENVRNAEAAVKSKGKVFQRLNDFADLFAEHNVADIRATVGDDWADLTEVWAGRHVFTHHDGIVDRKYLESTNSPLKIGQRLRITDADARLAIRNAKRLCHAICKANSDDSNTFESSDGLE